MSKDKNEVFLLRINREKKWVTQWIVYLQIYSGPPKVDNKLLIPLFLHVAVSLFLKFLCPVNISSFECFSIHGKKYKNFEEEKIYIYAKESSWIDFFLSFLTHNYIRCKFLHRDFIWVSKLSSKVICKAYNITSSQ